MARCSLNLVNVAFSLLVFYQNDASPAIEHPKIHVEAPRFKCLQDWKRNRFDQHSMTFMKKSNSSAALEALREIFGDRGIGRMGRNDSNARSSEIHSVNVMAKCQNDAVWLPWSEWSTCSEPCGSCGVRKRRRICVVYSTDCTCSGDTTAEEFCNTGVCRYPKKPCCYKFKVSSKDGHFVCLEKKPFDKDFWDH